MLSCFGTTARTLLLDMPLCILLLIFAVTQWYGHVEQNYLIPQYEALKFRRQRYLLDNTYYTRVCDESDMSTKSPEPLWLSPSDNIYNHQLRHGFTILPQVIPPAQATALREHILARNAALTPEESIYVIKGEHRYSFGLDPSIPVVGTALASLNLQSYLTPIIGPDAAIIELTAITSTFGAEAQWWHDDVVSNGSPVQYARSFGPSYSIFIPLQDTTVAMGATAICPGTHVCSGGKMHAVCHAHGFPVTQQQPNSTHSIWKQGDAMLMNMNSWHRGAAHTDPTPGHERVVLILTVVPVPQPRAESRQLSQGITFSIRPELWGHTLGDLAQASTRMVQPWSTLRALGLWKHPDARWGVDGITSASIRAANQDNAFREKDLVALLERGGLWCLPGWLQAKHDDIDWEAGDVWFQFITMTSRNSARLVMLVTLVGIVLYFAVTLAIQQQQARINGGVRSATVRLACIGLLTGLAYWKARTHVDSTGWASDIRAGRRYASTADKEQQHFLSLSPQHRHYFSGPSTLPNKYDILIETRYGSRHLALYNDFIAQGHPGNRALAAVIAPLLPFYRTYGSNLQRLLLHQHVVQSVVTQQGRFLGQGPDGFWMWLDAPPEIWLHEELAMTSVQRVLLREIRFVESEYKFGVLRTTKSMAWKHAIPYMDQLRSRVAPSSLDSAIESTWPKPRAASSPPVQQRRILLRSTGLQPPKRHYSISLRSSSPKHHRNYEEPYPQAWLYAGEEVEYYKEGYWYHGGSVFFITAQGQFVLQLLDGTQDTKDRYDVRRWRPYGPSGSNDDAVDCHIGEGEYRPCQIQTVEQQQQTYLVTLPTQPGQIHRVGKPHLRRAGPPIPRQVDEGEETNL